MEWIGKYKVLSHIGHGAMGSVEKAEAPDGTIVAIKTLFPHLAMQEEYVRRFQREAELAKKLSHPNVVKIIELGEDHDDSCRYIVMEYIDGKTLAETMHDRGMASVAVKRSSKLNEKNDIECTDENDKASRANKEVKVFCTAETIKIIRQLAGVLQAAADIGLLHRDVKPQNILLDKKSNVKLLDFGLAKDTEALVTMISMTGQSIGTPPYMSPELHNGSKNVDIRSDLYALGCTAYHMLTGSPPFSGPTASAFARQHCDDVPEPVHKLNQECPLNLSQLIDRLLAKNPADRHQSPAELIEDLNRVERGEVPLRLYKPKKSRKHSPVRNWLTVAAAIIIVAVGFIGWDFYRKNNAVTIINEAMSDARQMAVKHDFEAAKELIDGIIAEYAESDLLEVKEAEMLRGDLIKQHGKWLASETARKRKEKGVALALAEAERKRQLHNCLRNAARLKKQEARVKDAEKMVNKAYQLCNTDEERAKVAIVEKLVLDALAKMRHWAAVVDFTLDKSVEAKLTGSAVAVKLEQALGNKYRLVTRNQVRKALGELRFQSSDLADKGKAKKFGKLVGAEYLITGSVVQLGQEITVACQIFNIETGAIRQTAEVSALNVNDFNYMIHDAAKILGMSNAEKVKYVEKLNSSKRTSGGKYPIMSQPAPEPVTKNEKDRVVSGLGMKLAYVASGTFDMGSNEGQRDEKPIHKVTISNDYWIGKYEVTQKEYESIMGVNPSKFKNPANPVENVKWSDAVEFCKKLNESERKAGRLPSGYEYRLPTEAEWEFAARGGNESRGYRYSGSNDIDKVVWYYENSGDKRLYDYSWSSAKVKSNNCRPHNVGMKAANELGIYDMNGNVKEWCRDLYGGYTNSEMTDPLGVDFGVYHVYRSGSWGNYERCSRIADRGKGGPATSHRLGFRIALAPCIIDNKLAKTKSLDKIISGLGIKLVHVVPGSFMMGSNADARSKPLRKVTIDKAYWIGKYEVTQKEYQTIMGINPSHYKGDSRPVETVSWNDAVEFCIKLTEQAKKTGDLPSGYEYRLPTEAEWEFAARGGNKSKGYTYSGSNDARVVAWNKHTSRGRTRSVGQKAANELGIHDMSGNVYEWCVDNWHDSYNNAPLDAKPWLSEVINPHVYRSGGMRSPNRWCTVAHRSSNFPDKKYKRLGFRIVLAPVLNIKPVDMGKTIPGLGTKLVYVEPGSFTMGSDSGRSKEKPQRNVTLYYPYWIGKYEVTQKEYRMLMGTNPSHFKGNNKPVEKVSWFDAVKFCEKLTEREQKAGRLPAGYEYHLPTEVEWEFAARGGNKSRGYVYSGGDIGESVGWLPSNSSKKTNEVGQKAANELGIYDMSGNVYEWCRDDWHNNYQEAPDTGANWGEGKTPLRVRRGGGWCKNPFYSKTIVRSCCPPVRKYNYMGFRVVLRSKIQKPGKGR